MTMNLCVDHELNRGHIRSRTMSNVFEGYERQYCEISANLSKKCTAAVALNGGS